MCVCAPSSSGLQKHLCLLTLRHIQGNRKTRIRWHTLVKGTCDERRLVQLPMVRRARSGCHGSARSGCFSNAIAFVYAVVGLGFIKQGRSAAVSWVLEPSVAECVPLIALPSARDHRMMIKMTMMMIITMTLMVLVMVTAATAGHDG